VAAALISGEGDADAEVALVEAEMAEAEALVAEAEEGSD
jgi:hypothetical protein